MLHAGPDPHAPCGGCIACDVRRLAVCAALNDNEVGALERIMVGTQLAANDTLVTEGDRRDRVYTLTAGMLRLSSALPDGRRQITGFLLPGDYLGLADDETFSQTAEAVVPSGICAFPVREMERLTRQYPRIGERLLLMTRTALRQARDSQFVLGRLTPVEKVAHFLVTLATRLAVDGSPPPGTATHLLPLPMTRTDIADYLGLTIETVSRSFTKLKTAGLIRLHDAHLVEIVDRGALRAMAGLDGHGYAASASPSRPAVSR